MSMKYLLGIDNGGTTIKAALFDMNGTQVDCVSADTPLITPKEGWTQRNMENVRDINFRLISELVKKHGNNIVSIGISGHGKGLYILGSNKEIIYDGIGSTDRRALNYELLWNSDGTAQNLYKNIFQNIMCCQPTALLRYFKDNDPDLYGKIGYIMSVKDYVRFCLTGEIFAEYTDISGSGLLNLRTLKYDEELLKLYGISEIFDCLPPIVRSSDICGYVTRECADITGLKEGTPVVGGMFDIDACAISAGVCSDDEMCIIAGTWSINEYLSRRIVDDHTVSMNSVFCDPDFYLAEESSATSCGNLEYFRKLLNTYDYKIIDEKVGKYSPDELKLFYLPFLFASNENPLAKATFVGLSASHTQFDILRAVFEGVVFSHLTHVNALTKTLGTPKYVRLAGGAANSTVWAQMFSDTLGFDLELTENTQLGAKGAAMAAGIGAGLFKDYKDAIKAFVTPGRIVYPIPQNTVIYREKYERYREIVNSLDPIWKNI